MISSILISNEKREFNAREIQAIALEKYGLQELTRKAEAQQKRRQNKAERDRVKWLEEERRRKEATERARREHEAAVKAKKDAALERKRKKEQQEQDAASWRNLADKFGRQIWHSALENLDITTAIEDAMKWRKMQSSSDRKENEMQGSSDNKENILVME